jgi:hypothetical protein
MQRYIHHTAAEHRLTTPGDLSKTTQFLGM